MQIAPVGGVADQRLVALFQLPVERRDDGGAVGGVLLCFRLVAADDVVLALDHDLLDEELGVAAGALDEQRRERARSSSRTTSRTSLSVRSRAPRMYSSPRSSRAARVAAEIMPRSATTQTRVMPKAVPQPVDDGQQHGDIGRVARPHLCANRATLGVDDHADDHLLELGAVVLGVPTSAERRTALALEGQRGGVHEHDARGR